MIKIFPNITYKLIYNDKGYEITAYERISIKSLEKKIITLPVYNDHSLSKYLSFELDKKLSLDGISCPWTNINENESNRGIQLLLINNNFDFYQTTALQQITGSKYRIDIKPGEIIGRVYIN